MKLRWDRLRCGCYRQHTETNFWQDCTCEVSWRFKYALLTVLAVCKDVSTINNYSLFFLFSDKSIWSLETVIPKAGEVTKRFPSPLRNWQLLISATWWASNERIHFGVYFFNNLYHVLTGTKHFSEPQLFRGSVRTLFHVLQTFGFICEIHILCLCYILKTLGFVLYVSISMPIQYLNFSRNYWVHWAKVNAA